jgi:hypothetical protein
MSAEWWRRARAPFVEFGLAAGSLYLIARALRALSPNLGLFVYEFMVQPIGTTPLLPPNLSRNLEFRAIGRGHPDLALMPARDDIKTLRFEQGARCLGAYRKGQLLGYAWYCTGQYEEDEVRCTYRLAEPDSSIFDFDFYVLAQHRLGLGFLAVWQGVNETLHPRGVRFTYSRLDRFNEVSRRSHAHLGWRRLGTGLFLRAWQLELMVASLAPFVAVTWGPKQRVTLHLSPTPFNRLPSPAAETAEPSR